MQKITQIRKTTYKFVKNLLIYKCEKSLAD